MGQSRRNAPCPCGSGKKYKKCCMNATRSSRLAAKIPSGRRNVYITLAAIFFLALFLRYYGFLQPHGLTFDEGLYAQLLGPQLSEDPTNYSTQEAYRRITARGGARPLPEYLNEPLFKHPPLYNYLIALSYRLFGQSDLSAVSVSIVLGSLMVLVVYLLARVFYDDRVGLMAAFFLCIGPVHWVSSERIWMATTLSFFMLLAVFFFAAGLKQRKFMLLSGISIGLTMLTKYPGALALFIVTSFAILIERPLLKEKWFWGMSFISLLIFSPWVIWNLRVYGSFHEAFMAAYDLPVYQKRIMEIISTHKVFLLGAGLLAGILLTLRRKISALCGPVREGLLPRKKKMIVSSLFFGAVVFAAMTVPFLRGMVREAFVWKNDVEVGWSNPFHDAPWHFYLTRLAELSPLYIFSFLSVFLYFGENKGDKLMVLSSLWILGTFILIGNYQSRYILPAVPFLLILSARWLVLAYDKISSIQTAGGSVRSVLRFLLVGVSIYFVLKTLRTGSLIAIGPDFGYF